MARIHRTSQGTELPLLDLRGKDYLEVKYRLVWFREEHPDWSIETEFVSVTDKSACAKATVRDGAGRVIATSHKFENERGFPDFLEKAETGAIGRALALIGFGTQFCADELDEGGRIVDAPVASRLNDAPVASRLNDAPVASRLNDAPVASRSGGGARASAPSRAGAIPNVLEARSEPVDLSQPERPTEDLDAAPGLATDAAGGKPRVDPGDFQVPFGRKYRGKKVREIPRGDIESYLEWLEAEARKKGSAPSFEVRLLQKAVELHYAGDGKAAGSSTPASTPKTKAG